MAFGVTDYEEIRQIIGVNDPRADKLIMYMIYESFMFNTQEKAIEYISNRISYEIEDDKKSKSIEQIINNELLPHLGITSTKKENVYFIGLMINKVLKTAIGIREVDDGFCGVDAGRVCRQFVFC